LATGILLLTPALIFKKSNFGTVQVLFAAAVRAMAFALR
jgi:hypothetical protein